MGRDRKALPLPLICLFLLVTALLAAGCLDESDTGDVQARRSAAPAGFVQYRDDEKGYALAAPEDWTVQIVQDTYLLVQEQGGKSSIIIWPVYMGGKNAKASAIGLTSLTAGQVARQYPDFTVESMRKSADNTIVEVVGTYSAGGTPMKAVMTSLVKGGSGLFIAYEAPSGEFPAKEALIRETVSTFSLTGTSGQARPTEEVQLQNVRPQVYASPAFPQFPGGITMRIPQGWVAYQEQADTCSINWWAGEDQEFMTQTSALSQFLIFRSQDSKNGQVGYWQMYGASGQQYVTIFQNMPVNGNVAPETFLTGVLPEIGQSTYFQQYYPNLKGITNVRIVTTHPVNDQVRALFSTTMNAEVGSYDIAFTKSGVQMSGSAIVWAADFPGTPWWDAGMWSIFAPASEYAAKEQLLLNVFESVSVTPEWQRACVEVSEYQADVRNQVFKERQKSQDRIAEKWDDVILDRDRLYNPDTGDVYHVDIAFPDYYRMNRENFEMQNLRELGPDEWEQIPLDGRFYIR